MRRHAPLAAAVLVLALAFGMLATPVGATARGETDPVVSTTGVPEAPDAPSIIPRPNQGVAPTDAGDRGGALQTGVFVLIIAALVGIGLVVRRESRRARERRGF